MISLRSRHVGIVPYEEDPEIEGTMLETLHKFDAAKLTAAEILMVSSQIEQQ